MNLDTFTHAGVTLTCGSVFTGIAGMDLAFSLSGFDVRWQIEIDPFCQAVITKHKAAYWPNARLFGDVKQTGADQLEPVDVIFGGFPCQDVSVAGKRKGIKAGTRSGLWIEFARIIGALRPRLVLLENVPGILSTDGVRVVADLARIGYSAEWIPVYASDVGAPHRRKRWFCVAIPDSQHFRRNSAPVKGGHATPVYDNPQGPVSPGKLARIHSRGAMAYPNGTRRRVELVNANRRRFQSRIARASGFTERREQNTDHTTAVKDSSAAMGNPYNAGRRKQEWAKSVQSQFTAAQCTGSGRPNRISYARRSGLATAAALESIVGRTVNGLSRQLDGARFPARPGEKQYEWEAPRTIEIDTDPYRAARLRALGNAVVVQCVIPFAEAFAYHLRLINR